MWPGHAGEVSPCPVSGADVPGQAGVPQGYCHVQGALGQNTGVLTAWVGVRVRGESEVVITREWTEPRTSIYGMSMFYFGLYSCYETRISQETRQLLSLLVLARREEW